MTKALRRWAGRTGSITNADTIGGAVLGSTNLMTFGKDEGETYLRWANNSGVASYFADVLGESPYWQVTQDIRINAVPSAGLLMYQTRTNTGGIGTAQGNYVINRANATTPGFILRGAGDQILVNQNAVLGPWYRVQMAFQANTATASPYNGRCKARLTRLSDGVVMASGERLDLNSGVNNYFRHHIGKLGTASTLDVDTKNLVVANDAYEFLDPPEFVVVNGVKRTITSKSVIVNGAKVPATGYYRIVDGNKVPIT